MGWDGLLTFSRNSHVSCTSWPEKVIADKDEEGPIGVVDTALTTATSVDKTHPVQEISRPPRWWSQRCVGDR